MDLTTQALWDYSVRYVLVLMELRSRRVVLMAVTVSRTLAWLKQRIREATPFGSAPRFLVHDNDGILGQFGTRRPGKTGRSYAAPSRPTSPTTTKAGPIRELRAYRSAAQACRGRPPPREGESAIEFVARPVLGGLHHDYRLAA